MAKVIVANLYAENPDYKSLKAADLAALQTLLCFSAELNAYVPSADQEPHFRLNLLYKKAKELHILPQQSKENATCIEIFKASDLEEVNAVRKPILTFCSIHP